MKTLFFVLACFLSAYVSCRADEVSWHVVKRSDFAGSPPAPVQPSLEDLLKALTVGTSMTAIVTQCGLPSAQIDPAKWPLPNQGFMMSGGIIYHDGVLLGEEDCKRFRYDLPEAGQVFITTDKNRSILYAFLETTKGGERYLCGEPLISRTNLPSAKTTK